MYRFALTGKHHPWDADYVYFMHAIRAWQVTSVAGSVKFVRVLKALLRPWKRLISLKKAPSLVKPQQNNHPGAYFQIDPGVAKIFEYLDKASMIGICLRVVMAQELSSPIDKTFPSNAVLVAGNKEPWKAEKSTKCWVTKVKNKANTKEYMVSGSIQIRMCISCTNHKC